MADIIEEISHTLLKGEGKMVKARAGKESMVCITGSGRGLRTLGLLQRGQ